MYPLQIHICTPSNQDFYPCMSINNCMPLLHMYAISFFVNKYFIMISRKMTIGQAMYIDISKTYVTNPADINHYDSSIMVIYRNLGLFWTKCWRGDRKFLSYCFVSKETNNMYMFGNIYAVELH